MLQALSMRAMGTKSCMTKSTRPPPSLIISLHNICLVENRHNRTPSRLRQGVLRACGDINNVFARSPLCCCIYSFPFLFCYIVSTYCRLRQGVLRAHRGRRRHPRRAAGGAGGAGACGAARHARALAQPLCLCGAVRLEGVLPRDAHHPAGALQRSLCCSCLASICCSSLA